MIMISDPEILCDFGNHTAENPLYHPEDEALYWVDIPKGVLYRYHFPTGDHGRVYQTSFLGGFTIQADGNLLLFEDDGTIEILDRKTLETTTVVDEIKPGYHFNDVIADPAGRVFGGTKRDDTRVGRFYRIDTDGSVHKLRDDVQLSNGLGFTGDRKHLYHTESTANVIWKYDYDEETGTLSERRAFVETESEEGFPDGMTVVEDDIIWSARWNGGCLVHYDTDGSEIERVEFPAQKVSSLTFGGDGYDTAYVTTALGPGEAAKNSKEQEGPGAGAVFKIDLGVAGRPEFRSRVMI